MADVLHAGANWLAQKMKAHVSRSVVYSRGANSVTILATAGKTLLRLIDPYGASRMEWTDRDYLFTVADLILAGVPTTPARGDRIEDAGETFELMPVPGEPSWRQADPDGQMIRLHCKRVI